MFITHCLTVTPQLHNFDVFRTCTSSFCTVAWQLARFQLTRRIARSLGDSGGSCFVVLLSLIRVFVIEFIEHGLVCLPLCIVVYISYMCCCIYVSMLCFMFRPSSIKSSIVLCYNINKLTFLLTYLHDPGQERRPKASICCCCWAMRHIRCFHIPIFPVQLDI